VPRCVRDLPDFFFFPPHYNPRGAHCSTYVLLSQASKTTRAVAAVCTEAFQSARSASGGGGGGGGSGGASKKPPPAQDGAIDEARIARQKKMRRASLKKAPAKIKVIAKLTDDWFVPDMARDAVQSKLREARVGDFFVRESSSKPGDYAISVQSGKNLWTGLIHQYVYMFQSRPTGPSCVFESLSLHFPPSPIPSPSFNPHSQSHAFHCG
jgi:hypothetical protein